jgi:hypothetical protein
MGKHASAWLGNTVATRNAFNWVQSPIPFLQISLSVLVLDFLLCFVINFVLSLSVNIIWIDYSSSKLHFIVKVENLHFIVKCSFLGSSLNRKDPEESLTWCPWRIVDDWIDGCIRRRGSVPVDHSTDFTSQFIFRLDTDQCYFVIVSTVPQTAMTPEKFS